MYPYHYMGLFPPFPREQTIFVAMNFDSRFDDRWQRVIKPAVRSAGLEPKRVDMGQISDSVLTEILRGIANCKLFFADISTIGHIGEKAVRNGNVMYELGIAHARRLPEEVLIFRSDDDPLPFDVTNVRVNDYDPNADSEKAKSRVSGAIKDALKEIDLKRHLATKAAVESLDAVAWGILDQAYTDEVVRSLPVQKITEIPNILRHLAITHLLQRGLLATDLDTGVREFFRKGSNVDHVPKNDEIFPYKITPFGKSVHDRVMITALFSGLDETLAKPKKKKSAENFESGN